jgi:hypothetical protein
VVALGRLHIQPLQFFLQGRWYLTCILILIWTILFWRSSIQKFFLVISDFFWNSQILPSQDFLFFWGTLQDRFRSDFPPRGKNPGQAKRDSQKLVNLVIPDKSEKFPLTRPCSRGKISVTARKFLFSATVLQSRLDNSLNYWTFWIL